MPRASNPSRGERFRAATLEHFDLSDSEAEILTEAARTLDLLDQLAEVIERVGPTSTGAAGQLVVNPAVAEARQLRITLHRLLAALNLPDDAGESVPSGHQLRSKAGNAGRWAGHVKAVSAGGN